MEQQCPNCGKLLKIRDELKGLKGTCKGCGTVFVAGEFPVKNEDLFEQTIPIRTGRKPALLIGVVAVMLFVGILAGFAFFSWLSSGMLDTPQAEATPDVSVTNQPASEEDVARYYAKIATDAMTPEALEYMDTAESYMTVATKTANDLTNAIQMTIAGHITFTELKSEIAKVRSANLGAFQALRSASPPPEMRDLHNALLKYQDREWAALTELLLYWEDNRDVHIESGGRVHNTAVALFNAAVDEHDALAIALVGKAAVAIAADEKRRIDEFNAHRTVTKTEFYSIRKGMRYDEVTAVIGAEGALTVSEGTLAAYVWRNEDGTSCQIGFQNGTVSTCIEFGLKESPY